jgi:exodeoxyribonuclease V gamma subunit
MALYLKVSNSLSQLSISLCNDLKTENTSVFTPHYLITQTEGMNNWLKLQMAAQMGIAANYRFLKPNDLITHIHHLLIGNSAVPLSPENQNWLLFKLLAQPEFINRFNHVANYYNHTAADNEIKRMALAQKIADLFDQYQIYRPQLIQSWNAEKQALAEGTQPLDTLHDWQKYLWIKAKQLSNNKLIDKTLIGDAIFDALAKPLLQQKLKQSLPSVHLFGLSITTDYHLNLFYQIAQYVDITFHIINPAPEVYWFEDKSEKQLAIARNKSFKNDIQNQGNTLLTNWGGIIKDTFSLLFKNEYLLNAYQTVGTQEPIVHTLLHKIQLDIFFNAAPDEQQPISYSDIHDGSVSINACYTPVREVEVLYNYLVRMVDSRKTEAFSPRDIVVMVSDIDAYAPYIKAVFENAPYKFPFTIADESFLGEDTLSSALKAILLLHSANFTAEAVMQLLNHTYIRKRVGVSDVSLIRRVVGEANISFGIEGNLANETMFVSWKYGLQRIIYGICMGNEEEYCDLQPSIYPLDRVEGDDALTLIRFCHFVQVLIDSIAQRNKNKDLQAWIAYIEQVLRNLVFEPSEEPNEDYQMLEKQLNKYAQLRDIVTENLSYEVFSFSFLSSLGSTTKASTFVTGGITFCSLIPMRSIPFKVVALLGLNFDKFPRKEKTVSFSLIDKKITGDRNVKENDKHLFLETLLSAQQYLYISYIGQSVKDNTTIPPSALIDELLDYIQNACKQDNIEVKKMVTKHPLHSFSKQYDVPNTPLYNYLNHLQATPFIPTASATATPELDFTNINLDKLIKFFQNPFKTYYNNVLNIKYEADDVLLPENEIFELDNLQKWGLKNQLLSLDALQQNTLKNQMVKTGQLPLKNMAAVSLQTIEKEIKSVKKMLFDCVGTAQQQTLAIQIPLHHATINGSLTGVYDNKLVLICYSKNERKYLLEAYIKYLATAALGHNLQLYFISGNDYANPAGRFVYKRTSRYICFLS